MANLPINFRKSGEGNIASYDYFDLASGVGTVNLYGGKVWTGAVSGAILTTGDYYSDLVYTMGSITSDSITKELDIDFDLSVTMPLRIKGNMIVNVPLYPRVIGNNPSTGNAFALVKLRKWDGTTETDIISASSAIITSTYTTDISWNHDKVMAVKMAVPNTVFKKGETLRVTAEIYAWRSGTGLTTTQVYIGHDPKNRSAVLFTSSDPTALRVNLPVVIDL